MRSPQVLPGLVHLQGAAVPAPAVARSRAPARKGLRSAAPREGFYAPDEVLGAYNATDSARVSTRRCLTQQQAAARASSAHEESAAKYRHAVRLATLHGRCIARAGDPPQASSTQRKAPDREGTHRTHHGAAVGESLLQAGRRLSGWRQRRTSRAPPPARWSRDQGRTPRPPGFSRPAAAVGPAATDQPPAAPGTAVHGRAFHRELRPVVEGDEGLLQCGATIPAASARSMA